mgnify:CR=1 FL=1
MEVSFLELKSKQVINTVDGKCLGHITDVIFDVVTACTLGFVVPQPNQGFFAMFKSNRELFIPYNCVCKIGVDVILVELYIDESASKSKQPDSRGRGGANVITLDNGKYTKQ